MVQTVHRATIQQHETLSSDFASMKTVVEHGVAKVARTSADSVLLASQIAASDSDLTAVNAVSAEQKLAQLEAKHVHQLVEVQLYCCTQAWRAEELRQRLEAMQQEELEARAQHSKRAEETHSSRTQELETAENRPRCDQEVQEGTRCSARKPNPAMREGQPDGIRHRIDATV